MDQVTTPKKYPATTDEVAKLLGLQPAGSNLPMSSIESQSNLPIANLPVVDTHATSAAPADDAHAAATPASAAASGSTQAILDKLQNQPAYIKIAKTVLPYVGIFTIGLFLYYFFFSSVNFNDLFKKTTNSIVSTTQNAAAPQETALEALQKQDLTAYNSWISAFYYDVSDPKIIDPNSDNSGNGLSNFQKYLLNLNPKSYDTLGLGMPDSQAIAAGINPLTGAALTDAQKDVINKYFDMEVVMNRLTLANLQNPGQVAGANTGVNSNSNLGLRGLPGTPAQVAGASTSFTAPNTGADLIAYNSDPTVNDQSVDIDTNIPGHLDIPSLNVAAPIVWSEDTNSFEKDLETGVIHYPGTAVPGQIGTTYIAGHSSNYFWDKGAYNHIFTKLGDLKDDASFSVSVTTKAGKLVTYHYVVVSRQQYAPTDPAQITNTGKSLVALSTCWPVNTTSKRLVVYGQLTQVEK